ncbi:hypothetical protein CAOG_07582 [Capsaspora owczarzaki ATCC 30864]|uniref:hypothetical protein n=1 Tax=Capsaspora owczarzaki (strain ATCC 30864) TaxID=595528 RepID=UPI0003520BD7|nr:hypothetical protein CAOG_07582 [Capsaspora owczarzaki ATCC 30864]|eukprot:XP_004343456.2 hypothetical protein CAOG_07582 [Capsaspora owczarzaki ATCC 30864]
MENEDAGPNRRYRGDLIGDTLLPGSIRVHGKEERPKIVGTKTQRMHHMNKQQRVQAAQEDLKLEVLSSSALPPTSGNYQKALNRIPAAVVAPGLATALRGPSKPAHFQGGRTTASERDQQKFEKQVQEEMAVVVKRETEKLHKPIPMDKLQEVIGNRLVILLDENRAMVSRAPPKSAAAPPATAVPPPTPEGQPKLDAAAKAELKAAERARKLAALREAAYSAAEIVELAQQRKCDISLIDTQPERITLQLASTAIFEKAEAEMKNRLAQAESAIRTKIRNFNNRKEVQLTNSTAENDLKLKIVRARRFLKRGNLVMITVLFRRARKRTAKPFNRQDQERQMKLIMDAISDISTTGPEHFVLKTTMMSCLFMPNEKAKDAVVNIYNPTEEEDDDDDDDEDDLESEDEEDSSSDDDDSSSSDDDSSSSSDDDDDEQGQNAPAVQSNKNAKKQGGKAPAETKPTEKPAMSKYQMKLLQRQQAGSQPQQAQYQPRSSSKQ